MRQHLLCIRKRPHVVASRSQESLQTRAHHLIVINYHRQSLRADHDALSPSNLAG
jgi:hypothetical protein